MVFVCMAQPKARSTLLEVQIMISDLGHFEFERLCLYWSRSQKPEFSIKADAEGPDFHWTKFND
uniref:Uncharacterized protein n=1 Tax=Rhizophora mucronata TaxID=61149 RepID=A0A2P2LJ01_RHIMU